VRTFFKKPLRWPLRFFTAILSVLLMSTVVILAGLQVFAVWLNSERGTRWIETAIRDALDGTDYEVHIDTFHFSGLSGIGAHRIRIDENAEPFLEADNIKVSISILPLALKSARLTLHADQLSLLKMPEEPEQEQEQETPSLFPVSMPEDLYFNSLVFRADIRRFRVSEELAGSDFQSHLTFKHSIRRKQSILLMEGAVTLNDLQHPQAEYFPENLAYAVTLDPRTGVLEFGKLQAGDRWVALDASGNLDLQRERFQTKVNLRIKDPKQRIYEGFSNSIDISADLQGSLTDLQGKLEALSALNGQDARVQSLLRYDGGRIELLDMKGSLGETQLSGHLALDAASGSISGVIDAVLNDFSVIESFTGEIPATGRGKAQARFSAGASNRQKLDLSVDLQKIVYQEAEIESASITASIADLSEITSANVNVKAVDLSYGAIVLNAVVVNLSPAAKGFDLDFSGDGASQNPFSISGDIRRLDPAALTAHVQDLQLVMGAGGIRITGDIAPGDLDLNASLSGVDPAKVPVLPFSDSPVHSISGEAQLTGSFASPVFHSRMQLSPAVEYMPDMAVTAEAAYASEKLDVSLSAAGKGVNAMRARLSLPGLFQIHPFTLSFSEQTALDGDFQADLALDNIARQFFPETGPQLRGSMQAQARIGGTIAAPRLEGSASLTEGYLFDPQNDVELNDITAAAAFDSSRINLTSLTAKDRKNGTLQASGSLSFADLQNPDLSVDAKLSSMNLLRQDLINAELNADLKLRPADKGFLVSGTVTPEEMVIKLPDRFSQSIPKLNIVKKDTETPSDLMQNIHLDIRFSADNRIFVRGWGLDAELGGTLDVKGTALDPDIRGALSSIRGRYEEFGKRFMISRAILRFQGKLSPSPYLDVLATTKAENINANILIGGSVEQPKLSLESTPALPQDEILSRILFGTEARKISPFQAVQLAQSLRRLSGQSVGPEIDPLGALRSITGLDDITVNGAGTDNTSIGAGKYIGDRVYVEFEQGTATGSGAASVEVEVTPNITIESEAGGNGSAGAGVFWEWDY
jgi:translocation and assembly module TamB